MRQQKQLQFPAFILTVIALSGCASSSIITSETVTTTPVGTTVLVGATPTVLSAEFGQPALRRVDGSAQVWLYHSPVCGLNLILFPDSAGMPRVATAISDNNNAASCTASLHRQLPTVAAALEHPAAS